MDGDYFQDARQLDTIAGDLVMADWSRGINRGLILALANGERPFSSEESESAKVKTNFSDLTHTSLLHEARTQFANGIFQTGTFISVSTDWSMGQPHKVSQWSSTVEKNLNDPLIESIQYYELLRSEFGNSTLHGIGPSAWKDSYSMIPKPMAVADLLVPTNTELGFDNLPFVFLRKSLTAMQLAGLTMSSKRDPGWNMDVVETCLKWVQSQLKNGLDSTYAECWRPEKWTEEKKQMAGWYMSDRVPTVDVFDIYCYVEPTEKHAGGWVRRMILDSWSNNNNPPTADTPPQRQDRKGLDKKTKNGFLFSSGSRPVHDSWKNFLSVQYADLSAGFPAMHNSVRSLGWLAYSLCHVQNRLKCRILDSTFEALLQYYKVKNMDGVQRALKVELAEQGFIDETIEFVKQQDRWQPNGQFIELGLGMVKGDLDSHSKSFTATPDAGNARTEKTKFQYMAELQRIGALVSAGLNQFYRYQQEQDQEVFRRFCMPGSKDPVVRRARENCLRAGVPEKLINSPEAWRVRHERMMGQGNQTLELMVAESILKISQTMAPDRQQIAYRNYVTALTHNPQMAEEYYPQQQEKNTPAAEQARNDFATTLQGIPVPPVAADTNRMLYTVELLKQLMQRVQQREKGGGMVKPEELQGLALAAQCVKSNLKILAKNKANQKPVEVLGRKLGEIANLLKAFQQRLQQAAKAQQKAQAKNGNGDGGKTGAALIGAIAKAKIKEAEGKQKLAHKDAAFKQDMVHRAITTRADVAEQDLRAAADIHRQNLFDEPEEDDAGGGDN
jgi:hypothetical protein